MIVNQANSGDWTVNGPVGKFGKVLAKLRDPLGGAATRLLKTDNPIRHSPAILPSRWPSRLNGSDADVLHLHWINAEMLSISNIGRLRKPVVWTLHDMWPFCGAEHYTEDNRWREGYMRNNRPSYEGGVDLNRWTWNRKRKNWLRPMHIVSPSHWLAHCARESVLFRGWPISVIPNVLDTAMYQPLDRQFCRQALGLPLNQQIILFGALGGANDPRKGYELLEVALARLATRVDVKNVLCVVFGQSAPQHPPALPFPTRWMGHIHDDATLALLYNAADVMVVPSRQENLPQTATEPQACGCPVVAFDCTGFRDAVVHRETGYLARAFDTEDIAEGLLWILKDAALRDELGRAARARALQLWAPEVVVPQYLQVYESVGSEQGRVGQ
jgi:glycosyltransferase involved in cell wall biosynthesis